MRRAQGVTVPGKIEKMGYKGVDTTELVLDGYRTTDGPGARRRAGPRLLPDDGRRRGRPRQRRGAGLRRGPRAFELGIDYAQQREAFGQQIAQHQAVMFRLAEMATKVEAAHQMMVRPRA